ncbi:hypothetical protein BD410DRAFT_805909 [Rickenella mellea]|uniref:Uncharacterized protein n=1 Tax=Rickenella mellea TaxID=50990 RepID=A0A4Y7PWB6_9AGAM|nr:hypothetical protein BD410DRAFT_805909 [Rickenella mellea]
MSHTQSSQRRMDNEPLSGPGSDAGVKDAKPTGVKAPQSDWTAITIERLNHLSFRHDYDLRSSFSPPKDVPTTQAKEQNTSGTATSSQTPSKQSSKPAAPTAGDPDNANNTPDSGKVGGVKAKVADIKDDVGAKADGAKDAANSALPGSTGTGTGKSGSTGSTGASPPSPISAKHDSSEDDGKKLGVMNKLQGKMKVLSGKLGRDTGKVDEGKKMQSSA